MHKRTAFAHEREVRAVIWALPDVPTSSEEIHSMIDRGALTIPNGIPVPVTPKEAIEAVYIHPYASEGYHDVVRAAVERLCPELLPRIGPSSVRPHHGFSKPGALREASPNVGRVPLTSVPA